MLTRLFASVAAGTLFAIASSACGGGDEESSSSPSPVATITATAPVSTVIRATVTAISPVSTSAPGGNIFEAAPEFAPVEIDNVKYGGTFREGESATLPHWDPKTIQAGVMNSTGSFVYDKLFGWSPNSKDKFVTLAPEMAEKWTTSPDVTTFTIIIRKGIKWQNVAPVNGREMVADDAVFSINRYREQDAITSPFYNQIASVEAADRYTVVIKLKEPNAWAINDLFGRAEYVVAPEVVEEGGGIITEKAIGTGAFLFSDYTFRRGGTFVRNPDYYLKDANGKTLPYIDKLVITEITDQATLVASMRTGQIERAAQLTPQSIIDINKTIPDLRIFNLRFSTTTRGLAFNTKKAPWNDVRVRRAMGMLFNRDRFIATEYGDSFPWFMSTPVPWGLISNEPFTMDKLGPYLQFNPDEGRKLLREAGFADGKITIKSALTTNYPGRSPNGALVQQMYKEQGVEFPIQQTDGSTFGTRYYQRVAEDIDFTFHIGMQFNLNWFAQNKYLINSVQNTSFIDDPEVTEVVKKIKTTTDPAKARELGRFLWDYDTNGVWTVWLPQNSTTSVLPPNVKNWTERVGSGSAGFNFFPWLTNAPRTSP